MATGECFNQLKTSDASRVGTFTRLKDAYLIETDHADCMKRFVPIAAVAVCSLLLAGCQSKDNICAQYAEYARDTHELHTSLYKRFGIEYPLPKDTSLQRNAIEKLCKYYKT